MANLKEIPLNLIRENPVALRTVNKESEEFQGLVDSIKQVGVLNAINVREMKDPETGQKYYSLVDGLHRKTAAMEAGLETVPAQILNIEEGKVLEAQLMANVHKVETRPVEYSKQLTRILAQDPTLTQSELAAKLAKSPSWIAQRLTLGTLDAKIATLVDEGTINLSNAYILARLPVEEQGVFVERAMTMPPSEFTPTVNARIKEIRDAKREGRVAGPTEFVPIAHIRKMVEIKTEAEKPEVGALLIREQGLSKPEDIWAAALAWTLHLDPRSVAEAKAKEAQRRLDEEKKKDARKAERDAKKAAEAAKAADSVLSA